MKNKKLELSQDNAGSGVPSAVIWFASTAIFIVFISVTIHFKQSYFASCDNLVAKQLAECLESSDAEYRSAWGQFGDFMGGVINPIFGFLTIILLITELRATRQAARDAKFGQDKTERALKKQYRIARAQHRIENWFRHLDEFVKYSSINMDDMQTNGMAIDYRRLHYVLYPNGKAGKLVLIDNSKFLKSNFENILSLTKCLTQFLKSDKTDDDVFRLIGALDNYLNEFVELLEGAVSNINDECVRICYMGEAIMMHKNGIASMCKQVGVTLKVFDIAIKFEPESSRFNFLNGLCRILDSMGKEYFELLPDSKIQGFSKSEDLESLNFLMKISVPSPSSRLLGLRLGLMKGDLKEVIDGL